ncbi:MAG: hypothetical protein BGO95_04770 [Micrococcales bacterium 73-13]|nr:MAG: hypothetical protein BGO95_04770 [Micrococcales bacterium 73-13]
MDPRIVRTRRSLRQAALELATERALDEITVGDIAERAGVNRSSFYQHYSDKETLLADALDAVVEETGASLEGPLDRIDEPPAAFLRFIGHVDEHAELYRWALGPHGSSVVTARLRSRVEALVLHHLALAEDAPFEGIPDDIVAAGVAGSGLGAVRAWVEGEPRAPVPVATGWLWRMLLLGAGRRLD